MFTYSQSVVQPQTGIYWLITIMWYNLHNKRPYKLRRCQEKTQHTLLFIQTTVVCVIQTSHSKVRNHQHGTNELTNLAFNNRKAKLCIYSHLSHSTKPCMQYTKIAGQKTNTEYQLFVLLLGREGRHAETTFLFLLLRSGIGRSWRTCRYLCSR